MVWWFGLKKLIRKEREKVIKSFEERDKFLEQIKEHTSNNYHEINSLKNQVVSKDEIKMMIENAVLKSQIPNNSQSHSQNIPPIPTKSYENKEIGERIEARLINRVRRNKKNIVMNEINKLPQNTPVIEMYEIIVLEKGLCSRATFYRYMKEMDTLTTSQSQSQPEITTEQ